MGHESHWFTQTQKLSMSKDIKDKEQMYLVFTINRKKLCNSVSVNLLSNLRENSQKYSPLKLWLVSGHVALSLCK